MEKFKELISNDRLSIFILSDIHEGNVGHNEKAFKQAISLIEITAKTSPVIVFLNGDIIDCIEMNDPRFNPVEVSDKYKLRDLKDLPRKQADNVIENLLPIKDLIKYAVIGNHEENYIKRHHFDVYDYYCQKLECKKLGSLGLGKIILKKSEKTKTIDIGIAHGKGRGGGKTIGYAVNYCKDIFFKFDIDIGICGHIHNLLSAPDIFFGLDKNMNQRKKFRWYVVAGCFFESVVNEATTYVEGRQGNLAPIGCTEIQVRRNGGYEWQTDILERRFEN
jgi:UDP-2,3-diacylglucosamine pyrophosphatase LpxH